MKRSISSILMLMVFGVLGVSAQVSTFADSNVEYSFDIPTAKWKMTAKPSVTNPNVEYVFVDRNDGHMEVRKLSVPKGSTMPEIIRGEEDKLKFLPGYVAGEEENFAGRLRGRVFNFEYVKSARPMSGRFYFLQVDDDTVYVLRFTGFQANLRSIRNQTDAIARTFGIKKAG